MVFVRLFKSKARLLIGQHVFGKQQVQSQFCFVFRPAAQPGFSFAPCILLKLLGEGSSWQAGVLRRDHSPSRRGRVRCL